MVSWNMVPYEYEKSACSASYSQTSALSSYLKQRKRRLRYKPAVWFLYRVT